MMFQVIFLFNLKKQMKREKAKNHMSQNMAGLKVYISVDVVTTACHILHPAVYEKKIILNTEIAYLNTYANTKASVYTYTQT